MTSISFLHYYLREQLIVVKSTPNAGWKDGWVEKLSRIQISILSFIIIKIRVLLCYLNKNYQKYLINIKQNKNHDQSLGVHGSEPIAAGVDFCALFIQPSYSTSSVTDYLYTKFH